MYSDSFLPICIQYLLASSTPGNQESVSVFINLPFLDISYKCNHTICNLSASGFFHLVLIKFLRFVPVVAYISRLFFFIAELIFHCMSTLHFVYPFTSWWTFGLLPVLGYCDWCCYKVSHRRLFMDICFHFSWVCS